MDRRDVIVGGLGAALTPTLAEAPVTGAATIEFDDGAVDFGPGQGVEVAPGLRHRFINRSDQDVVFLTISAPTTTGDRTED